LSFIDNAHAPAAQLFHHPIVRDRLPDHWRESYVREKGQVNESQSSFSDEGFIAVAAQDALILRRRVRSALCCEGAITCI
jgi:hypothetical protein